ncbi:MAG: glycoside hydrolase family 3 protein [Spirochaetales bacterium]|nr:glycoside hydrolase family 3 protein [Spirochaetales bacterium]
MALIKKYLLSLILGTGVLIPLFSINFFSDLPDDELAHALVEDMTDEELVGQILMFGYQGATPSADTMAWITGKNVGSIKIFGWNANDLSVMADTIGKMQDGALASRHQIPLIIATDQEGGWVRHVRGESSITPGNLALGASGIPYDSYMTGYYIAQELHRLGINMNFAPTVDVFLNPLAEVIGPRAFSQDPVQTGVLGTAFYKGMEEMAVITTAKHYPGHGNADEDSHGTLPVIPSDLAFLKSHDLVPYKMMIQEGLPTIMVGHLAFPEITGNLKPSSLCPIFLKEILRDELGFEGLVITDDLVMSGARYENLSLPEICEEAVRAGSDLLLVSRSQSTHERIWDHLIKTINTDEDFREDVKIAAERVLFTKLDYLKRDGHVPFHPDPEGISRDIPSDEAKEFFFAQAVRSATTIKQNAFPLPAGSTVLAAGLYADFRNAGSSFFEGSTIRIPNSFDSLEKWQIIDSLKEQAAAYDYVVFGLSRKQDLRILSELEELEDKLIVISSLSPIYLNDIPWVKDAIAVYGTGLESYQAGMAAIRGDYVPGGRLPIDMLNTESGR